MKRLSVLFTCSLSLICSMHRLQAADLITVYNDALNADISLRQAITAHKIKNEDVKIAIGGLLPALNLSQRFYSQNNIANWAANDSSLGISFTLIDFAKFAKLSIDKKIAHVEAIKLKAAEKKLMFEVTEKYFDVLAASEKLETIKKSKKHVERSLEQVKARYRAGMVKKVDLLEAEKSVYEVLGQQLNAYSKLNSATEALRMLTNKNYSELTNLNLNDLKINPATNLNKLLSTAYEHNLSLVISRLSKEIALNQATNSKLNLLPKLSGETSVNLTKLRKHENNAAGSVSLSLSMNLFNGGQSVAEINKSQLALINAMDNLEKEHRMISQSIRTLYTDLKIKIQSIITAKKGRKASDAKFEAEQASYETGITTIEKMLSALHGLSNADNVLSDARYEYLKITFKLKQILGTLNGMDIQALNAQMNVPVKIVDTINLLPE